MRILKIGEIRQRLEKSVGPYMGPRGGLWADADHTIPWKPDYANDKRNLARIEAFANMHGRDKGHPDQRYRVGVLREHGVIVHPDVEGAAPPPPPPKLIPRLFHSTPSSKMAGIAKHGLKPRKGQGTFNHGGYDHHSQGKVFLSDSHYAAQSWHSKVEAMAEYNHGDKRGTDPAVMLRVTKHVSTEVDPVGNKDVDGSRMTSEKIAPEHLEFWHPEKKAWAPVSEWHRGLRKHEADDLAPEEETDAHGVEKSQRLAISLRKAKGDQKAGHKYRSRKPDGKGGWLYEYDDDVTPKASYVAWQLQSTVRHALALHGNVDLLKKLHEENPTKDTKRNLAEAKKDASYTLSKKEIKEAKKHIASATTDEDAHALAKQYEEHLPTMLGHVLRGEKPEREYSYGEYEELHAELHGKDAVRDTALREPATTDLDAIAKKHGLGKVRINEELPAELREHLAGLVSNAFDDLAAALGSTKLSHGALAIAVTGGESIYTHGYDYGARYKHPKRGYGNDARNWNQDWYQSGKEQDMPPTIEIDTHNVDALAHEFGHAVDEAVTYFGPNDTSPEVQKDILAKHRAVLAVASESEMGKRAKASEKPDYWANYPELFARTFEQYVATKLRKQGRANSLLTRHTYNEKVHGGMFADQAIFERDVEPVMDAFMSAVKQAGVLHKAFRYVLGSPRDFAVPPVLTIALRKAGPPPGYMMAPNSKHGGYRKKVGGKWVYWYEGDAATTTAKPQWSEAHFAAGKFDKNPEHWSWTITQQRMIGGVAGGVDLQSKQPVKIAGMPHRLWQIVDAEKEPGWAQLRDVKNGEKKLIEHERVMPVHWQIATKPAQSEQDSEDDDDKEPYDPTAGEPDDGPVTGYAGKRIPPFEASVAPEGTALWSIENGAFQFKAVQRIIADADGVPRKVKRIEPYVPDAAKVKLISEFEPLLRSAAKRAYKLHALKPTMQIGPTGKPENLTMQDLQTSATEGLLRALQHYPGSMSFAAFAKHYVHGHTHIEAGRMRLGGVKLAEREQRMLPGFIAARAAAGRTHSEDNPSAEQVAAHWKLHKRDLHRGLSSAQGAQPIPLGTYQLRGEGAGGPKSLQHYPGKVELAERLLALLEGERATVSGPDETEGELFPGTGGRGLDTEPKISAQRDVKRQLKKLEVHVIEADRTSYRANTATVLIKLLGLDGGEPMPLTEIVRGVSIERKTGDSWKAVSSHRQQRDLAQRFVDAGLKWLRKEFEGSDIEGVIARAGEKHGTREVIPSGPTYNEIIRKQATKITPEQVTAWRKTEVARLQSLRSRYEHELSQHEPGTPEHNNAKMFVAQVDDAEKQIKKVPSRTIALRVVLDAQRESAEMRKLQTQLVIAEPYVRPTDYHEVMMIDPAGNQRKVRVRKVGGSSEPWSEPIGSFNKSEGSALTSGMLAEHMRWPLVTRALYAPTDRLALLPTQARLHLEGLVGLT